MTLLMVACETTWKNRPHVGDYENERIIFQGNNSSNEVYCEQPDFNDFICWHYSEVTDLISILKEHGITPREAKEIKKLIKKLNKDLRR